MRCDHEQSVGAYVLDALELDEQLRMAQHVQECPVCGPAARELEGLPRLLAGVQEPGEPPPALAPSEAAYERLRRIVAAEAASGPGGGRRWLWAAVAAVLLLLGGGTAAVVLASPQEPAVASAQDGGLWASTTYEEAGGGTRYELEVGGLSPGQTCEFAVVDDAGQVRPIADWTVTHSGAHSWDGWFDVEPAHLVLFLLRDGAGETLLRMPA
ncbi:hypothetical protein [Geodermatophilus sp. SYSU D00815]